MQPTMPGLILHYSTISRTESSHHAHLPIDNSILQKWTLGVFENETIIHPPQLFEVLFSHFQRTDIM